MANSESLDIILNVLKKGTGGADAKEELEGVEKAAKAGGAALASFDTSSKAVWRTLASGGRAAQMTSAEMGRLATQLGVASDSEVQATIKMNQLAAAWEKGEISSDELAKGINELGDETDDLSDDMGDLSTDVTDLSKIINVAMVAAVAKGALELGKMAYELGEVGAKSLRTKAAFDAISGGATLATANLDAMRTATRGAMTETDMMAVAAQMLQMGLVDNAEGLGQMTEMATRLGSAMGMEAGPAMENWNLMIANQSIPRLDSYGISASKVRTRMAELQAATAGLDRETAFMTAVMEEGAVAMERLGPAVDDDALAFERLEATVENLKTEFAEGLAPVVADVAEGLTDGIVVLNDIRDIMDVYTESLGMQTVQQAHMIFRTQGQVAALEYLEAEYRNITEQSLAAADADMILTQNMQYATSAAEQHAARVAEATQRQQEGAETAAQYADSLINATSGADIYSQRIAAAAQDTAGLAASLKDATSAQIASRLIGMLDPEKMGADAYGAAVAEIGTRFEIMDIQSIALAENMGALAEAIEDGVIPTENADDALIALIDDARDGQVDIENLTNEFSSLAGWSLSAGAGMRNAAGGMQGIGRHQGEAVEGIAGVGNSAATATGQVGGFADQLGITESKLATLVAGSPWVFSVTGSSGGIQRTDIRDDNIVVPGIGGGNTTNTNNSRATTNVEIINYIYDSDASRIAIEEQRRLMDNRIGRSF